mgnify:CR=1
MRAITAVVVLSCLSLAASGVALAAMAQKKITIIEQPAGTLAYRDDAGNDARSVRATSGDEIRWKSGVGRYVITFPKGTPLNSAKFEGKKDQEAAGSVQPKVTKRRYKYNVLVTKDDGTVLKDDPEIIIDDQQ